MTQKQPANRIIVFACPKGGAGRSTCTAALARALALRDRRVLIVDNNGFAGGLSSLVDMPRQNVQDSFDFHPVQTSCPKIDIVAITPIRDSVDELFEHWRNTYAYDDIIIDLRSGFGKEACDLFLHADLPILLINAEPATIQSVTIWLRQVIVRQFENQLDLDELVSRFSPCRDTWDFDTFYANLPPDLQHQFVQELSRFRCALLINLRREHSEEMQGIALSHAFGILLGANIEFLGSIPVDERRWFFTRRLADVSLFNREDPLVHDMDEIARDRLTTNFFVSRACLPLIHPQMQPRDFLRVDSPEAARHVYRQLWEGYRRENGMVSNILTSDQITKTVYQLEMAYRNAEAEPASPVPPPETPAVPESPVLTRSFSNTFVAVKNYDPEQCPEDAGQWLQAQRTRANLTLPQLAQKTRLPKKVLESLENRELETIPVLRLQAYLFEIAKALNIDIAEVRKRFGF